jgi:hypothetical protein
MGARFDLFQETDMGLIIVPGQREPDPEPAPRNEVLTPEKCAIVLTDRLATLRPKARTESRDLLLSVAERLITASEYNIAWCVLELINVRDHGLDGAITNCLRDLMIDLGEGGHWPQECRRCGCTNEEACPGGCAWIEPDLCDACFNKMFPDLAAVDARHDHIF